MTDKNWFDVDRKGLAKLIERRGKSALIFELVGNALDADGVSRVEIVLEPENGVPHATVVVRDDAPDGFADITHAWTLFAESNRKAYAIKRGRFNLGEKLVLALCNEASIISTKGAVMFDSRGRTSMKARRPVGTEFMGIARITRAELAEMTSSVRTIIPPANVTITINGATIPPRPPLKVIEATLPTEIADKEGNIRRTSRKTTIEIVETLPGETATLYEMGIPVVETGDKWHVVVGQKVPLSMNVGRDNVTPSYLRELRTHVVNAMHEYLTPEDASTTFVNDALANESVTPEAVNKALDLKFGEKRAIFDPSDLEANMNLVEEGYTLIKGSQLNGEQWSQVKRHATDLKPSGQIKPTKKVLFSPDGVDKWVPRDKWTPAMAAVADYTRAVTSALTGVSVHVGILCDITESAGACYGDQGLIYNLGRLGHEFFDECVTKRVNNYALFAPTVRLNALIIHEIGHHYAPNHLSDTYHESLCSLGAKLAHLAVTKPEMFAALVIVATETFRGNVIEIHEDQHGHRRYWVKLNRTALYQHGRMRLRMFVTKEGALKAARFEVK